MYGVLTFLRIVYIYLRNIDITIYLRKIIYIIYLRNTWIISRREGEGGGRVPARNIPTPHRYKDSKGRCGCIG